MKNTHAIKSLVAVGLITLANLAAADLVVIVNPKSPLASMTPEQVSAIFLGKTNTLPSGATAAPVDLPESSAVREQFYSKAAGKTSAQVKATWARLTFSGKAQPPKNWPPPPMSKSSWLATPMPSATSRNLQWMARSRRFCR